MRQPDAIILASSLLLCGCATSGQYDLSLDPAYVSSIEHGITTKADVRSHIGEPNSITVKADQEFWQYVDLEGGSLTDAYRVTFGQRQKIRSTTLQIAFKDDVVTDYALTTTKVDATCR